MTLLEQRRATKKRKPTFRQQDSHKLKRLQGKWRRPRGIDSKTRLHLRSHQSKPSPGWGSPKEVKGLDRAGVLPVWVANVAQLEGLDAKKVGVVISSHVGMRKRKDIFVAAEKKGLKLLNAKPGLAGKIGEMLAERKKVHAAILKRRDRKVVVKEPAKKEEKPVSDEDKAKAEKAEKDKVLTRKEP